MVLGLADPALPAVLSEIDLGGAPGQVAVWDQRVLAARGDAGVRVVDLTDPQQPVDAGGYDTGAPAYGVAVDGGWTYVADEEGLRVLSPACFSL